MTAVSFHCPLLRATKERKRLHFPKIEVKEKISWASPGIHFFVPFSQWQGFVVDLVLFALFQALTRIVTVRILRIGIERDMMDDPEMWKSPTSAISRALTNVCSTAE